MWSRKLGYCIICTNTANIHVTSLSRNPTKPNCAMTPSQLERKPSLLVDTETEPVIECVPVVTRRVS